MIGLVCWRSLACFGCRAVLNNLCRFLSVWRGLFRGLVSGAAADAEHDQGRCEGLDSPVGAHDPIAGLLKN
ncbi:hypothetical protein KR100_11630 [Synechococcus sp. KORDI-100]|nr:hypothetical protein KR100_11630 [Synechococcus sp. KORDI-100]